MTLDERLYRMTYLVRRTEETIAKVYSSDVVRSPIHLSLGQEAVSVGICAALRPTDKVFGSYRSHALYLSKGGDLRKMMAELYGKSTGCTGGWGGSMHLVDSDAGLMATSAIVASTIPLAVGYAYAERHVHKRDTVVACFFGDGAAEEGAFHEALNFAALKRLPVLFVCENNGLAIHQRQEARQPLTREGICGLARAHGIEPHWLPLAESADPLHVYEAAKGLVAEARGGDGPRFLECVVERWAEHVGPGEDWALGYREKPALMPDPVALAGARVEPAHLAVIEAEVEREIKEAVRFAEESPWPT